MGRPPEGKRLYGTIPVSERGQIEIPAETRRDWKIEVGVKLLVSGDPEKDRGIPKASVMLAKMPGMIAILALQSS